MLLTALIQMLAAVIPVPSGIGSVEYVFTLFFGVYAGSVSAVSAALMYRFATFLFPCIPGECWPSAITGGIKKEKSLRLRSGRSIFQIIEDFFGKKEKDTFQVACKFLGSGFIFLGQPADQGGNQPVIEKIQ